MADITKIDPNNFELQFYDSQDTSLISSFEVDSVLTGSSYIEFFVYDLNNNLLSENQNYIQYTVENDGKSAATDPPAISKFDISPDNDVSSEGFDEGEFVAYYNFLSKRIGDFINTLFISEISSDRTEIRLDSTNLSNNAIVNQTNEFINYRETQDYFVDFYLNFGSNNLIIANNIKLENSTTDNPTVVVKLYEALPLNFDLKDFLWIVTTLNEPEAFQVTYPIEPITFTDSTPLQGPNFNIPLKGQVNNSSQNLSYTDIISSASTSSQNQINSLLEESSIDISVDYTDFKDFIHFSSAQTRIENFNYKVGLLESYSSSISNLSSVTSSNTSRLIFENKISECIKNFDKFEYFMYYNSGSSFSWPKTTSSPPYELAKTDSTTILTWYGSVDESNSNYGGRLLSASNYDNENKDLLLKSIPEYLREDTANKPYELFIDMVAQYFDNVWLYTKDITQKYNADNRLDFGVSKELVSRAIQDFGVKLYQNNFSNKDLYTAFLGITPSGSLFPFPEITSTTPVPTGFEFVDTLITATNDIISMDDVNKSLYKRIYHNIPYLLKSKGTLAGLRALITSYGIPDTILKISEFGGKDKVNANDYDLYFNDFNQNFHADGTSYISTQWALNSAWESNFPNSVQFRFKPENYPPTAGSQSIFFLEEYGNAGYGMSLVLETTGSGLTSGSYSGSIKDPYHQYANLKFYPDYNDASKYAQAYLPFFDGGFWSVMITSASAGFELSTGNKIYNGNDGTSVGYFTSSIVAGGDVAWSQQGAYFAQQSSNDDTGETFPRFSGSLQEIRYYTTKLSESVFKDYIMNPLSIEGNGINSTPNQLAFRVPLKSELDITNSSYTGSSIHPKITGSWNATTSSFSSNSIWTINPNSQGLKYLPNTETFFLDQPAVGIKNRITDKIRFENNVVPSGDTLSPYRRVAQTTEASASFTENINYLEVAFSPQNQINDDIIGQLGHFNIGDYIGDPRQRFSGSLYPELNTLSEDYFKKYLKQYDLVDFVRLIKFFDNSLFKMIKDFIPARTSLASGLVIKQHLLERNKYPQPTAHREDLVLTGSINIAAISGGAGGMLNIFNGLSTSPVGTSGLGPDNRFGITQSWSETNSSFSGSITRTVSSQEEFYTGEFSGSTLIVSNGELNAAAQEFKEINPKGASYGIRAYNSDDYSFSNFINVSNNPTNGFIQTWFQDDSATPLPPPNPTF